MNLLAINRHKLGTDGRGITTLVGLAHCPLKCDFCLNKWEISNIPVRGITPEKLLGIVMADYCYFVATQGGVTFGGAEPMLQAKEIAEFIGIKPVGMRVNIETSLNISQDLLDLVIDKADEFIIDVKDINPEIYNKYTGMDNVQVLSNLEYIASRKLQDKCKIRVPLIPGYNTESDRDKSVKYLNNLGFSNINKFNYVVRR